MKRLLTPDEFDTLESICIVAHSVTGEHNNAVRLSDVLAKVHDRVGWISERDFLAVVKYLAFEDLIDADFTVDDPDKPAVNITDAGAEYVFARIPPEDLLH